MKELSEWNKRRIQIAIQAYSELHPKPKKAKQPDMNASKTGRISVFLRNNQGELIAIYGETTGKFWKKLTSEKIKKHSIKINPPKVQAQSIKPQKS